jgi:hypothetical protein
MSPFDHRPEDALHLIQYRPHHNCARVAEFVGVDGDYDDLCGDGPSDQPFDLDDGRDVQPGDWIATSDYKTFEVVTADDLLDYIKGTSHTRLET